MRYHDGEKTVEFQANAKVLAEIQHKLSVVDKNSLNDSEKQKVQAVEYIVDALQIGELDWFHFLHLCGLPAPDQKHILKIKTFNDLSENERAYHEIRETDGLAKPLENTLYVSNNSLFWLWFEPPNAPRRICDTVYRAYEVLRTNIHEIVHILSHQLSMEAGYDVSAALPAYFDNFSHLFVQEGQEYKTCYSQQPYFEPIADFIRSSAFEKRSWIKSGLRYYMQPTEVRAYLSEFVSDMLFEKEPVLPLTYEECLAAFGPCFGETLSAINHPDFDRKLYESSSEKFSGMARSARADYDMIMKMMPEEIKDCFLKVTVPALYVELLTVFGLTSAAEAIQNKIDFFYDVRLEPPGQPADMSHITQRAIIEPRF